MARWSAALGVAAVLIAATVPAQVPPGPPGPGPVPPPAGAPPPGPPPTHADLDYAPPEPPTSHGHELDLYNQGERLYMALNKACRDAVFVSLPRAPHGNWAGFLTDDALREAATMRSTASAGCTVTNPTPYTPTWKTVVDFLDTSLKR
jgi:hypothetical protein